MITRRQFLKYTAIAGAAAMLPLKFQVRSAQAYYASPGLKKWKTKLRGVGPAGIPVALPDPTPAPITGATHYTIDIQQFTDQLHPDFPMNSTTLWGYNPTRALGVTGVPVPKHLGGIIIAQKGVPIQITFRNNLPPTHILPVDTTIMGAEPGQAQNRVSVHLHGGLVPWISDGGPHGWWAPDGTTGASFMNNTILNPLAALNEAEYYYPNNQSARLVWYHDHALGITRLNAYAGIASAFIIRDAFEAGLITQGLPAYIENGGREIPIVIQDKIFVNKATILTADPTWTGPTTSGSLWYPHVYDPAIWALEPGAPQPQDPSVIPEMFGDTMLANGTAYPEVTVEARRYRLRILNACQARFLNLQLYVDNGTDDSITLDPAILTPINAKGPDFLVLGTEGGFLPNPVLIPSDRTFDPMMLSGSLITAPAERWDLIVDFTGFANKKIVLYNDAPAPFPMGNPLFDYFPGAPGNRTVTKLGRGPNTRQIMRFKVKAAMGAADIPLTISPATDLTAGNDPLFVPVGTTAIPAGVPVRQLTINEAFDAHRRLIQLQGTNEVPMGGMGFGRMYDDPPTETPTAGSTEVWQIANLTADTHPVHFHLVNVQILSRQPFDAATYMGTPTYTGPARPPDPEESGWKDTVRMHPGEVTTVMMKFDLPTIPGVAVPLSTRTGVTGHEYVWHCHILEHEEHDMMRPLIVVDPPPPAV